jgi:hypothetical protein
VKLCDTPTASLWPQNERSFPAELREWAILTWMHRMGARLGAIALLAMLVRALVPAGYMLAHADTGNGRYLTVTMCLDHGGAQQVIDLDTGRAVDPSKLPKSNSEGKQAPCVFAASAHVAPPVVFAQPVEFVAHYNVEFGFVRDVRPGQGIAAPPPPATGPPSSV